MPETKAQIGLGAKFGIKSGTGYSSDAEITKIVPPGWTRSTVDATHLQSPDGFAEFIGGLKSGSDCTFDLNWVPAENDELLAAFEASKGEFQIVFPSGTIALQFVGVVTEFKPGEVSPEGKIAASVTIKPSGRPSLVRVPPSGG